MIQFSPAVPVSIIDLAAIFAVVIVAIGVSYRLRNWLRVVPSEVFKDATKHIRTGGLVRMFFSELSSGVLLQRAVFTNSKSRLVTHLMVFWGFVCLAIATVWDDLFFRNGILPPPFSLRNIGNLIGNVGGVLLVAGITIMVIRYAVVKEFKENSKGDLSFLLVMYFAGITGFLTEFSRYSIASIAYTNYAIHLALVAALLICAPFTHFFHAVSTPLLRYIERIQIALGAKGVDRYPYYRRETMSDLANSIREDETSPVNPSWLDAKDEK